ncbi:hypothetical protein GW17_00050920 [Ensete ventricosum]|nr:hypothetical protein GW17_00050920 [Ensete ventricosum]
MNDTINVFDLDSSPMVTGRVVVLIGEMESLMNPVNVDVTGSISGTIDSGHSINDQKNREGRSPHKEIASDGWASGIPWTSAANRPTNRARVSSLPCVRPRSNVVVTLGRELARKLSLNSLARESTEEMDDGLSRLYHIRVGPLRVVGKAWHIRESEVS